MTRVRAHEYLAMADTVGEQAPFDFDLDLTAVALAIAVD